MERLRVISESMVELKNQELRELRLKEVRLIRAEAIIKDLVDHARPSFPKTPFRKALDEAKKFLEA